MNHDWARWISRISANWRPIYLNCFPRKTANSQSLRNVALAIDKQIMTWTFHSPTQPIVDCSTRTPDKKKAAKMLRNLQSALEPIFSPLTSHALSCRAAQLVSKNAQNGLHYLRAMNWSRGSALRTFDSVALRNASRRTIASRTEIYRFHNRKKKRNKNTSSSGYMRFYFWTLNWSLISCYLMSTKIKNSISESLGKSVKQAARLMTH